MCAKFQLDQFDQPEFQHDQSMRMHFMANLQD